MNDSGVVCPNCNTRNDEGASVCSNCKTPLTAYAGQLSGASESQGWTLASQVEQVEGHPIEVKVMSGFLCLYALLGPLATTIGAFSSRPQIQADSTNYLAAATSTFSAIMQAMLYLPCVAALAILAWAVWAQRTWAWGATWAAIGIYAIASVMAIERATVVGIVRVAIVAALAVAWTRPSTRAWYGY